MKRLAIKKQRLKSEFIVVGMLRITWKHDIINETVLQRIGQKQQEATNTIK